MGGLERFAAVMTGRTGALAANPDNTEVSVKAGSYGELAIQELNGKFFELARRGLLYSFFTADTGIALLTPATTGNHPTIWNKDGSGLIVVPLRLNLGYVSGANAPGHLILAQTVSAGSAIGTAAPIVTFTDVPAQVLNMAPSKAVISSKIGWSPAVSTYTVAPAKLMDLGISLETAVAASTNAPYDNHYDFDGSLILPPGSALHVCAGMSTTTALFSVNLICAVMPKPVDW